MSGPTNGGRRADQVRNLQIFGMLIGAATLLYFMAVALVPVFTGKNIPCSAHFALVAALAVGCALSSGVIGGTATAKGSIPWFAGQNPLVIGATGGVAVLVIVFAIGWNTYIKDCKEVPAPAHPNEITLEIRKPTSLRGVIGLFSQLKNVNVDTSGCSAAALDRMVLAGEIREDGPQQWLEKLSYRVQGPGKAFTVTEVKAGEKYALTCN